MLLELFTASVHHLKIAIQVCLRRQLDPKQLHITHVFFKPANNIVISFDSPHNSSDAIINTAVKRLFKEIRIYHEIRNTRKRVIRFFTASVSQCASLLDRQSKATKEHEQRRKSLLTINNLALIPNSVHNKRTEVITFTFTDIQYVINQLQDLILASIGILRSPSKCPLIKRNNIPALVNIKERPPIFIDK